MPPRPRPLTKKQPSNNNNTPVSQNPVGPETNISKDVQKSMPPPPPPQALLEPEITAMATCLKKAVVKTGEIYKFYGEAQRIDLQRFNPRPPQVLTSSLGRELEKYDQFCDIIESQLRNAIAVLQKDLAKEEEKARKAAQEEAAKSAATQAAAAAAAALDSDVEMPPPPNPRETDSPFRQTPNRRQSVISMSALHRPASKYPELRLDLSAASLRLSAEEAVMFTSGLANNGLATSGITSPVTLAPKSGRPMTSDEFERDMIAAMSSDVHGAHGGDTIDLTSLSDSGGPVAGAGTSAEQPINLDLDGIDTSLAMDLFGDGPDSGGGGGGIGDGLFSPAASIGPKIKREEEDEAFLQALQMNEGGADGLFGLDSTQASGSVKQPRQSPSPGTLLASFGDTETHDTSTGGDPSLDMGSFDFGMDMGMDMDMGAANPLLNLENVNFMGVPNEHPSSSSSTRQQQ